MVDKTEISGDFDAKPDSALISVRAVATLLDIHTNSVWRLARSGKLPAPIKLAEQTSRWRVGDLRKTLANLKSS